MDEDNQSRLADALLEMGAKLDTAMAELEFSNRLQREEFGFRLPVDANASVAPSTRADLAEVVKSIATRTDRIEDEIGKVRDSLTIKIDRLSELIAGFSPRLVGVEVALTELRSHSAPHSQVEGLESRLSELSSHVDEMDETQSARTSGLSTQINAWLVSLIGLVVGALVAYSLLGHH